MFFSFFYLLVLFAFIIRTIRVSFTHIYLWQLKEYRFDRFWYLLKTAEGKKLIFSPFSVIKWILLIIIFALPSRIIIAFYLFWLVWLLESIQSIRLFLNHNLRFPRLTLKSSLILFIVIFAQFNPVSSTHWAYALIYGPFLDKLLAPTVVLAVLIVNIPFSILTKILNILSSRKLKKMNTVVIGITGSYGKTSTKEFLYKLLSAKYKVAKSPHSFNTELGISLYILNGINGKRDYFIAEMGAYRIGEIKNICKIVKPKIAILTGLGNQHLQLFGSRENIIKAKFELITSLPRNGLVVLNVASPAMKKITEMAENYRLNVYKTDTTKDVKNLKVGKTLIDFDYSLNSKPVHFKVHLAGVQHLANLVLAIKTASLLGVTPDSLKKNVSKITSPQKTMQIVNSSKKLTLIDDTFNVNYEGVIAGINYLKLYRGIKAIVLNPIIELGRDSEDIHNKIGQAVGVVCDYLVVTNSNYLDSLKKGILNSGKKKTAILLISENAVKNFISGILPDSVVLFTGKESAKWIPVFNKHYLK